MRRRRILLIAAGLLALCCLGAVISVLFFPESDDIAEETATVQVADMEIEPSRVFLHIPQQSILASQLVGVDGVEYVTNSCTLVERNPLMEGTEKRWLFCTGS
ncbi:MAG: hypothetical protein KC449_22545 [Anaerolineales bacterium]|nr:hypothetical protein [Anaerolineales bacterium]